MGHVEATEEPRLDQVMPFFLSLVYWSYLWKASFLKASWEKLSVLFEGLVSERDACVRLSCRARYTGRSPSCPLTPHPDATPVQTDEQEPESMRMTHNMYRTWEQCVCNLSSASAFCAVLCWLLKPLRHLKGWRQSEPRRRVREFAPSSRSSSSRDLLLNACTHVN